MITRNLDGESSLYVSIVGAALRVSDEGQIAGCRKDPKFLLILFSLCLRLFLAILLRLTPDDE